MVVFLPAGTGVLGGEGFPGGGAVAGGGGGCGWGRGACVGLVGNTCARLSFSGPERLHRVVLMHGARARIEAGNYAVVSVMNRGGEVEIVKDDTAIIFNE